MCLVVAMAIVGIAPADACAQDDPVVEEKVEIGRNDERTRQIEEAGRLRVEARLQRSRAVYQSQFEDWVKSQFRTRVGVRHQLETLLAARVRQLTAECRLTDEQATKLELAGRGDIKRFTDRFDSVASTMDDPKSSIDDLRAGLVELQALQKPSPQRLFGESSLLGKTLAGALDPEQSAAYRAALVERNKERHESAIASAATTIQTNLGLSEGQRAQLRRLLLDETRPPRRFGDAPDVVLVLYQASRIAEDKIKPIFDDGQWQVFQRWMSVYINRSGGKETLINHGFVFDDELPAGVVDREKNIVTQRNRRGERTD